MPVRVRIVSLLTVAAALLSCQGSSAPGTAPTAAATATATATAPQGAASARLRISFTLQDADGEELLRALAMAFEGPVVVDPAAERAFAGARFSVFAPATVERGEAVGVVDAALRPKGFTLRAVGAGYLVAASTPDPSPRTGSFVLALPLGGPQQDAAARAIAGVREVSPKEREVREAARTLLVTELGQTLLGPSYRIVHETPATIRIFGVRADSLLARLGLENGDVITGFGTRDASAASALEALAEMKTSAEARVTVMRRGAPMELRYRVVP